MQRRAYWPVLANNRFMRLWSAQIVSNLGDWAYTLAVAVTLTATFHGSSLVRSMALLLVVEGGTSTLVGLTIAGPIADRYSRVHVMVVADLVRCLAVLSLLLSGSLHLPHVLLVAAVLGSFRAVFHPAMMASVPTLVAPDDLPVANGVLSATYHLAIMVGPAIGGILVAAMGANAAFLLNAMSFGVSAVLLIGLHLPEREHDVEEPRTPFTPWQDLLEGARFLRRSRAAWGIAMIMTLTLMLLATQSSFQAAFVGRVLAPEAEAAAWSAIIGTLVATFGAGMVLGSLAAPTVIRRVEPRRAFAVLTTLVGVAYLVASQADDVPVAVLMWGVVGMCGGTVNVLYETWLQMESPDRLRGRVFAAVESTSDAGYVLGAVLVAALWAAVSPATAIKCVGIGFILLGLLAAAVLPKRRPLGDPPND
jgi:DHA3 family macrolide efflux protein-like MFS transporter